MALKMSSWGNGQGIRVPVDMLKALNITKEEVSTGLCLDVEILSEGILIKKKDKQSKLEKLFEGYNDNYTPSEFNWGESVGKEL